VKVYETTTVLSMLCYNSETWTLTAEMNRKLTVFEIGCLRRILNVSRRDHMKMRTSEHTSVSQRIL